MTKKAGASNGNGSSSSPPSGEPSADRAGQRATPSVTPAKVALPTGGGAIRGMGESFQAHEFSGTVSISIPLATTAAREFEPSLSLTYTSGDGNGPFGLGFSVALPAISLSTAHRVPRYDDTDHFLFGSDTLVPLDGGTRVAQRDGRTYDVVAYAPRVQQTFERIERWTAQTSGDTFFRTIDRDNTTSLFGLTAQARIADPADASRVFSWLVEASFDADGNAIGFSYKAENRDGVPDAIYEQHRVQTAKKYVETIRYGNVTPATPDQPLPIDPAAWHFFVVFDYGEYDVSPGNATPFTPVRSWRARRDPFSTYEAGFEIRTHRLCQNVLLFHRFDQIDPAPVLMHVSRIVYDESPRAATVIRLDSVGYAFDGTQPPATRYSTLALPPLEFGYVTFEPQKQSYETLRDVTGRDLPGIASSSRYSMTDLRGEGLPGVLYADGETVRYWAPELAPDNAPAEGIVYTPGLTPAEFPLPREVDGSAARLIDLSGNGRLDLLLTAPAAGFYESDPDGRWSGFTPLVSVPTTLGDPSQMFVDVTGDGLADLLQIDQTTVRYAPSHGKEGYGPAVVRTRESDVAQTGTEGPGEWLGIVDLFGSGQQHVVRVRDGMVACWPNLGYGRFGPRVLLGNAPRLPASFDESRVVFADLDGSGTADLVVIEPDRLRIYMNESGNAFAEPFEIALDAAIASPDQVQFLDVHGTGTDALVLTPRGGRGSRTRVYDFSGGRKPYLMSFMRNNLGAELELFYASSTRFYLEDKRDGLPWITTLPFPVQVIERFVQRDLVSDVELTRTFRYHHGFYDGVERKFRGFGMVERFDSELFARDGAARGEAFSAPPMVTKTWYHTGAWRDETPLHEAYAREYFRGDPREYAMPGPHFDWGAFGPPDADTRRQAYAALYGTVVRSEVYGLDGSAAESVPYEVSGATAAVTLLQPPRAHHDAYDARHKAIFFVGARESIEYDYSRAADDPRVAHDFTLEYDRDGDVRLSVSLVYGRRADREGTIPPQRVPHMTVERFAYARRDTPDTLLLGFLTEQDQFETLGVVIPADSYLTFDEVRRIVNEAFASANGLSVRLLNWQRNFYEAEGGGEAPPGVLTPQALLVRSDSAAYVATDIETLFAPILPAQELRTLLETRGLFRYEPQNGCYWRPTPHGTYFGPEKFYLPSGVVNPLGETSHYRYDATALLLEAATIDAADILPHVTSAEIFDYQSMLPVRVLDANRSTSEVILDELGMVIVSSYYGKENGANVGFAPIVGRAWPRPADTADVIEHPSTFLRDAASFFYYDVLAWMGVITRPALASIVSGPAAADALWNALVEARLITPEGAILTAFRELGGWQALSSRLPAAIAGDAQAIYARLAAVPSHVPAHSVQLIAPVYPAAPGAALPENQIAIEIEYFDGFGRIVQDKQKVEPGPAIATDGAHVPCRAENGQLVIGDAVERWVTTSRVRYNNKGKPYQEYDPYFIDTWRYTGDAAVNSIGVPYTLFYDALSRLVRVDTPKGFFRTQTYQAWVEIYADEDDTIVDSPYYRDHIHDPDLDRWEREALLKGALCYDTPSTSLLDPLGRTVFAVETDVGLIDDDAFVAIGFTAAESAQIVAELHDNGFLDFRGALTIAFQPADPGFSLHLPPPYEARQAEIIARLKAINAAGQHLVTRRGLDIAGREIWSIDPRLWAIWQAEGGLGEPPKTIQTRYGLEGDTLRVESADAGTRYMLFDMAGKVIFAADDRGYRFTTTYDGMQRLREVWVDQENLERKVYGDTLIDGQPPVADPYAFNLIDEVYSIEDPSGQTMTPSYSILGDPLRQTQSLRDVAAVFSSAREYDAIGRITAAIDPDGNRQELTYLRSGGIGTITLMAHGGTTYRYLTEATYNARGQREQAVYADGVLTRRWIYDSRTQALTGMEAITTGPVSVQDLVYYYDAAGNVTHLTDRAFAALFGRFGEVSGETDYTTDALYRLVHATGRAHAGYQADREQQGGYGGLFIPFDAQPAGQLESYDVRYAVDQAGNPYWMQFAGAAAWTRALVFSDRSNRAVDTGKVPAGAAAVRMPPERIVPAADVNRFFDGNGNQTSATGLDELTWTPRNSLAAVRTAGATPVYEAYAYDATGRRTRKIQFAEPGGDAVADVLYLAGVEIHRNLRDGSSRHVVRLFDEDAAIAEYVETLPGAASSSRLLLDNALGSAVWQLGADGALLNYEEYVPYGGTAWAAGQELDTLAHKDYRYAGQERDRETGLYYYGARYYAPWLLRWLSPDPAGTVGGLNLYQFVGANPIRYTDVGGNVKVDVAGGKQVDISASQILSAVKAAGISIKNAYTSVKVDKYIAGVKKRRHDTFMAKRRGDLLALAFNSNLRGSGAILPLKDVTPFYLMFGSVESSMSKLNREKGVHGTRTLKNKTYDKKGTYGLPGYPEMHGVVTRSQESTEARRLIRLLKVKEVPSDSSYNNRMIPVMAISESDRSEIGGLLAFIELHNIKYGRRTFFDAFATKRPYFIGAERNGGAKALKSLDRGDKLIGRQQQALDNSLVEFVKALNAKSKFLTATSVSDVQSIITNLLVRRTRPYTPPPTTTTTQPSQGFQFGSPTLTTTTPMVISTTQKPFGGST